MSKKTALLYNANYKLHNMGNHPESPERISSILKLIKEKKIDKNLKIISVNRPAQGEIYLVHRDYYVNYIQYMCNRGYAHIDTDTWVCKKTLSVAKSAVKAVIEGLDLIISKKVKNAFCLVRPPGHHSSPSRAMGFCFFNNVAVAARYLQKKHQVKKILIVDWDAHHGNGTQEIFYRDNSVMYFSIHQKDMFPLTGYEDEIGEGRGKGYTVNVPVKGNISAKEYVNLFEKKLNFIKGKFKPEFILVSAGFDGHKDDAYSNLSLSEKDYAKMTKLILNFADETCNGKLLSVLEGGYHLSSLQSSILLHLNQLINFSAD
jgi:acetoin utilization deacetylase AcuC-like enzyme